MIKWWNDWFFQLESFNAKLVAAESEVKQVNCQKLAAQVGEQVFHYMNIVILDLIIYLILID